MNNRSSVGLNENPHTWVLRFHAACIIKGNKTLPALKIKKNQKGKIGN